MNSKKANISTEIPTHAMPFISEYKNVRGDGNCGYRAVAYHIYGLENQWKKVRKELYLHIESRLQFWMGVWHLSLEGALTILRNLNHYKSPCPQSCWMSMDYMGPVIATTYNVILVSLDRVQIGNLTYLPLYVAEAITTTNKLIGIAFLRDIEHFVAV